MLPWLILAGIIASRRRPDPSVVIAPFWYQVRLYEAYALPFELEETRYSTQDDAIARARYVIAQAAQAGYWWHGYPLYEVDVTIVAPGSPLPPEGINGRVVWFWRMAADLPIFVGG